MTGLALTQRRGELMRTSTGLRHTLRAVLVTALSAVLLIGFLSTAGTAAPSSTTEGHPDCAGRGIPTSKISIQLWTFAEHIGFADDAAAQARLEEVLRRLSEMGYRNVEPFSLSGLTAEEFAALLHEYGLRASARHVNVGTPSDPVDIGQVLEDNHTLGIRYFGSGATPRDFTTEAEWIAYAEYLDQVGEQARMAGQRLMVHNHNWEFEAVFGDRTAYDILMQYTDPRNVVFQLDLYWATYGGADPVTLLERYGHRIQLFHVKDMRAGDRRIEIVGRGIIDFPEIFAAAGGGIRYYVVEHDPRFGDPTFDPFEAATKGFAYLDCVTFER
jgi:sugar phosphate isomerase/epimerase